MPAARVCRDCIAEGITTKRPIKRLGRCATHLRAFNRRRSLASKSRHVETTYGITEAEYQAILKAQGGVCYICRKKPGKRRLSVDHDHHMGCGHDPKTGCPKCIRGLLHSKCNSYLGWVRDDPAAMERGAEYLRNPPARLVLALMRGSL